MSLSEEQCKPVWRVGWARIGVEDTGRAGVVLGGWERFGVRGVQAPGQKQSLRPKYGLGFYIKRTKCSNRWTLTSFND